jgi:hypothetical protein
VLTRQGNPVLPPSSYTYHPISAANDAFIPRRDLDSSAYGKGKFDKLKLVRMTEFLVSRLEPRGPSLRI